MIRVEKPCPPQRLDRGSEITEEHCEAFDENSADYQRGVRKFTFQRDIYSHQSVRRVLETAQFRKCCFCEGTFNAYAPGDVEHYRPKGAVFQDKDSAVARPGYFWLAYSWENLFWCCQVCNRSNKRDLFPLKDPGNRALSHHDDLAHEVPLILDPGGTEDPREHIAFRQERAVGLTDAGRTTIQVVGLNRVDLVEARLARLVEIKRLLDVVGIWESNGLAALEELAVRARRELENAVGPGSVFSAMAADYLSAV